MDAPYRSRTEGPSASHTSFSRASPSGGAPRRARAAAAAAAAANAAAQPAYTALLLALITPRRASESPIRVFESSADAPSAPPSGASSAIDPPSAAVVRAAGRCSPAP